MAPALLTLLPRSLSSLWPPHLVAFSPPHTHLGSLNVESRQTLWTKEIAPRALGKPSFHPVASAFLSEHWQVRFWHTAGHVVWCGECPEF